MITEPEMAGGPEQEAAADLLSGHERPPRERRPGPRPPWLWALGGIAATCAIGALVLHATGYGRTSVPDLHGYRAADDLCSSHNLEPIADALGGDSLTADPGVSIGSPALVHVACVLYGSSPGDDGWSDDATVSVTVDLHKRTDPRAEFEEGVRLRGLEPVPGSPYAVRLTASDETVRPYSGLGDSAYLITSTSRQSLSVLYGGAVVSLTVDGIRTFDGPALSDGSGPSPGTIVLGDSTALRPLLPATMRHLMSALAPRADASGQD